MISSEIIKKVKKIELRTKVLVEDIFGGEYHSVFKGHGIDFAEVREYSIGDDVRNIDWNVTARTGRPYVKRYEEERELTVMLMIDASTSGAFGTNKELKRELAASICALLAFSAIKNNDKVGLLIFTQKVEKYIPPKKGKKHVMRVITEILSFKPEFTGTNITEAIEFLARVLKRRSICFLASDFFDKEFERDLRIFAGKHDLIALCIKDRHELSLPVAGIICLEDSETGEEFIVDTTQVNFVNAFSKIANNELRKKAEFFKKSNIDFIEFFTGEDYTEPLIRFFKNRAKRFR